MQLHKIASYQKAEAGIALLCLVLSALMAFGAIDLPSEAGYQGVGPNFLPWVVSVSFLICGSILLWQALTGGFRNRETPEGSTQGNWLAFVWVCIALLTNAALITTLGFILSCALCFAITVRGIHQAEGRQRPNLKRWLTNLAIGFAISAPVFWMFGQVLDINLPSLTGTHWL
jgi:putative tricarboxylic transport membrane protein